MYWYYIIIQTLIYFNPPSQHETVEIIVGNFFSTELKIKLYIFMIMKHVVGRIGEVHWHALTQSIRMVYIDNLLNLGLKLHNATFHRKLLCVMHTSKARAVCETIVCWEAKVLQSQIIKLYNCIVYCLIAYISSILIHHNAAILIHHNAAEIGEYDVTTSDCLSKWETSSQLLSLWRDMNSSSS